MLNSLSTLATSPFFLIMCGAVFVHACFQLSVSVLTLLSSHTIGRRLPNNRLLTLSFWYILGVVVTITLLQLGIIAILRLVMAHDGTFATAIPLGIAPLVAIVTVLFYYRRGRGTRLWLPRPAADYITTRAKRTRSSVEAFALGVTTAITELPFALAPLAIVAFIFQGMSADSWLQLAIGYALAVCVPLIFVAFYISSGHKVSSVQRWREDAKEFLRWTSASMLVLLTIYSMVLHLGPNS